jgi:hypothetical protein
MNKIKIIIHITEYMTEYIEIDILKEDCFICFDSRESEYITLKCCNRHNIHKTCLFNIFLNYVQYPIDLSVKNSVISCPLCRQEISITDYFTLDECIALFMEYEVSYKKKFMIKFNAIITYNYIDSNYVVSVDKNPLSIIIKSISKKVNCTIVAFILVIFILLFIGIKYLYS